ncbi:MAG: hypothetical protein ABIN20_03330 [candidate division WOR-3 bacterium]
MILFRIDILKGPLSFKAEFDVWCDKKLLYKVIEKSSDFFRNILFFTKLRMAFPLEMEFMDFKTGNQFNINRGFSFLVPSYKVSLNRSPFISFYPRKIKLLPFFPSFMSYEIRNSYNRVIGFTFFKNPFIFGFQKGEVKDAEENTIATFEWKNFSLWKGYKNCDVLVSSEDERWSIISIISAIIKGLYLQQR